MSDNLTDRAIQVRMMDALEAIRASLERIEDMLTASFAKSCGAFDVRKIGDETR